ncbi:ArnT family glycosyltransferase [Leeuwenhoekiella sp. CH_XMU1409-2]|uniref:ArnT family glycosyltransferase n=1 Tax=Leeuwenhoekiella sp. CH_XMU1409-2 TaxID=3107768 RepID=UPI003FA529CF
MFSIVINYVFQLYKSLKNTYSNHSLFLNLFISTYTFLLFYLTFSVPLSYDEITTLSFFVPGGLKGIYLSITFYPAPNNHVFYSLLANIAQVIPSSTEFSLRLPSVISSILSCFILFHISIKFFNKNIAKMLTLLFISLHGIFVYSFLARGYSLYCLLYLMSFYSTIRYLHNRESVYLILFSISSVLGFYTIPSYLYAFFPQAIFLILFPIHTKRFQFYKPLTISLSTVGLSTILLYTPIIWRMGISALISNRFVKPKGKEYVFNNLIEHFESTLNFITAINGHLVLYAIVILSCLSLFIKGSNSNCMLPLKPNCLEV